MDAVSKRSVTDSAKVLRLGLTWDFWCAQKYTAGFWPKTFSATILLRHLRTTCKRGASAGTLLMPGFNQRLVNQKPLTHKLRLLAAFAALLTLALAAGCRGFFVNPTLTSLAVAPTIGLAHRGKDPTDIRDRNLRRWQHQGFDRERDLEHFRSGGSDGQQGWFGDRSRKHRQPTWDRDHHRRFRHAHGYVDDHGKHRSVAVDCCYGFDRLPRPPAQPLR